MRSMKSSSKLTV